MNYRRNAARAAVLLCGLMILFLQTSARQECSADESADLKARLVKAWSERAEKVRTIHLEWVDVTQSPLTAFRSSTAKNLRVNFPGIGEMITYEREFSVRVDGEKFDYRKSVRDGKKMNMPIGYHSAFDGAISQYYGGDDGDTTRGVGIVTDEQHAFNTGSPELRPILATYRGLHPRLGGVDMKTWRLNPERVPIGDDSCVLLEQIGDGSTRRIFWVEPGNGFVVRRYQAFADGREGIRTDVTYGDDPKYGLVPTHFTCVCTDSDGKLSSSTEGTIAIHKINVPIPDAQFKVIFPPGTRVEDRRTGRTFRSRGEKAGAESGEGSRQ